MTFSSMVSSGNLKQQTASHVPSGHVRSSQRGFFQRRQVGLFNGPFFVF